MFASIRKYSNCTDAREVNRIASEQIGSAFKDLPGFVSYTIIDSGNNTVLSISVFEDRQQIERANERAREIVQSTDLSKLITNPPEITVGEVLSHSR